MAKWAIELLPLDIKFEAKKAIADFLTEWSEQQQPTQIHSEHWTMFFDGSKMLNGSGAGVVLLSPRGDKLSYVLQIHLILPTMKLSMKRFCTGCVWPFHSASVA